MRRDIQRISHRHFHWQLSQGHFAVFKNFDVTRFGRLFGYYSPILAISQIFVNWPTVTVRHAPFPSVASKLMQSPFIVESSPSFERLSSEGSLLAFLCQFVWWFLPSHYCVLVSLVFWSYKRVFVSIEPRHARVYRRWFWSVSRWRTVRRNERWTFEQWRIH